MPALSDHYAILVAINRYPGIKNLYGPENDADEFQKWLLDPAYGNLAPANVRIIKSSDFAAVADPDDANPTETQFKKVLNGWLRTKDDWKDQVGARLYLFFAGHGFTTGNLANPALFTAQAQWGDPAHIAGLQYAAKIQNAGFFDEIVLVMDCCQDVLKATQVMDPTWTPPDRLASSRVKFLQAFSAPRGQKAFETPQDTPLPRGYFSSCLLEAFRDAPSDAEGYVTARAVDETLATIWKDRYWEATRYNPPVYAPLNMRLYRRFSPPMVVFPQPVVAGGGHPQSPEPPPVPFGPPPILPSRNPELALSAPGPLTKVAVTSVDSGARIEVFSEQFQKPQTGFGSIRLELPTGSYTARYRIGDAAKDVAFHVTGELEEMVINERTLEFSSPIPIEGTATNHEYHHDPANRLEALSAGNAALTGYLNAAGTLLVFARDSAHGYGATWAMAPGAQNGLRIRKLDEATGDPVEVAVTVSADGLAGYSSLLLNDMEEGTYLVGVRRKEKDNWYWVETPITVASSWLRTEIYMDCVDDDDTGRRFDLDSMAVLVTSGTAAASLNRPSVRTTEIARLGLMEGHLGTPAAIRGFPDIESEPMLALYSAYALTFASKPDVEAILLLCNELKNHWSQRSADVKILERWARTRDPDKEFDMADVLRPDEIPMLSRGWQLLRELTSSMRLSLNAQYAIRMWRVSSPFWTQTMISDRAVVPLWNTVEKEFGTSSSHTIRLEEGNQDLDRIATALSRPNPAQSPVQQVVRRTILDARESGDEPLLEDVLSSIAKSLGLDQAIVRWALDRLLMRAAIGMLGEYGSLIPKAITRSIGLEVTEARRELVASSDDAEPEPPLTMTSDR